MAVIEALVRLGTSCGDATSAVSAAPMPSCAQARQSDAIRCNPCNRDSHLMWCDALGQTYLTVLVLAPCKDGGALMVVDERQHVEEAYRHGAHVVRHQLQHQRRLAGTLARQISLSLSLSRAARHCTYNKGGAASRQPHTNTRPVLVSAADCAPPAATCTTESLMPRTSVGRAAWRTAALRPSWPLLPSPHAYTANSSGCVRR